MILDVRRALFYAPATRRIYVGLPAKEWRPRDKAMCGLLCQSLHGTQDAAQKWDIELGNFMQGLGFTKGRVSWCRYHHQEIDMAAAVHGDDVTIVGTETQARWLKAEFEKEYEMKSQHTSNSLGLAKEGSILNRKVVWTPQGFHIDADSRGQRCHDPHHHGGPGQGPRGGGYRV